MTLQLSSFIWSHEEALSSSVNLVYARYCRRHVGNSAKVTIESTGSKHGQMSRIPNHGKNLGFGLLTTLCMSLIRPMILCSLSVGGFYIATANPLKSHSELPHQNTEKDKHNTTGTSGFKLSLDTGIPSPKMSRQQFKASSDLALFDEIFGIASILDSSSEVKRRRLVDVRPSPEERYQDGLFHSQHAGLKSSDPHISPHSMTTTSNHLSRVQQDNLETLARPPLQTFRSITRHTQETRQMQDVLMPSVDVNALYDFASIGTGLDIKGNGRYSHGNVFDIETKEDNIVITSISINTQKPLSSMNSAALVIYTKFGSYKDMDRLDRKNWKLQATTPVVLMGAPDDYEFGATYTCGEGCLTPFFVPRESVQTILILMATVDVLYTEHLDFESSKPWVEDDKLKIYMGAGVGIFPVNFTQNEDYNQFFEGRLWHGNLTYALQATSEPTQAPSGAPSIVPTALPTLMPTTTQTAPPSAAEVMEPHDLKQLRAPVSGRSQGQGVMFDIAASAQNVVVRGLKLALYGSFSQNVLETIQVYHINNPYEGHESIKKDWTKLLVSFVKTEETTSAGQKVNLVEVQISPTLINKGSRHGFYITFSEGSYILLSTGSEGFSKGSVWAENSDLKIFSGSSIKYAFAGMLNPAGMNGVVVYSTIKTESPSPAPTSKPTSMGGGLETQIKLSIKGMSRRALRQLSTLSDDSVRKYFEEVGSGFLDKSVNRNDAPPIKITHFVVSPNIDPSQVSRALKLSIPGVFRRYLQGAAEDEPSLDVYQTILGEYSPPPVVDFSSLVEDSFNDSGDDFISGLKESSEDLGQVFAEARSVKAETVSFPMPPELLNSMNPSPPSQEPPPSDDKSWIIYVWVACGLALLLVLCVAFLFHRKTKREKEQRKYDLEGRETMSCGSPFNGLVKQSTIRTLETDLRFDDGYTASYENTYDDSRSLKQDEVYDPYKHQLLAQNDESSSEFKSRNNVPGYKAQSTQIDDGFTSIASSLQVSEMHPQDFERAAFPRAVSVRAVLASPDFYHELRSPNTEYGEDGMISQDLRSYAVSPVSSFRNLPASLNDGDVRSFASSQISAPSGRRLRSYFSPSSEQPRYSKYYDSGISIGSASPSSNPCAPFGGITYVQSPSPSSESSSFRSGIRLSDHGAFGPESGCGSEENSDKSVESKPLTEDRTVMAILADASLTQTGKLQLIQQIPNLSSQRQSILQDAASTKTQKLRQLQTSTIVTSFKAVDEELLKTNASSSVAEFSPQLEIGKDDISLNKTHTVLNVESSISTDDSQPVENRHELIQVILRHTSLTEEEKKERIKKIIDSTMVTSSIVKQLPNEQSSQDIDKHRLHSIQEVDNESRVTSSTSRSRDDMTTDDETSFVTGDGRLLRALQISEQRNREEANTLYERSALDESEDMISQGEIAS